MIKPYASTQRRQAFKVLYLVICLVGLYGIVPQLGDFHDGFSMWRHARLFDVLGIILFCALSYGAAALTYCLLAFRRLRYPRTLLVEFASNFINRLLPAGVGGIGTNYAYLRRAKHTVSEASAVVAVNNTLGFLGHVCVVAILVCLEPSVLHKVHLPHLSASLPPIIVLIGALLVVLLVALPPVRQRLGHGITSFMRELAQFRNNPLKLCAALLSSMSLTLTNIMGLWLSASAVGLHVSFVAVAITFTVGIGIGTVTPTPGGLGGVEAGLVAGLVAYHISAVNAVAAVLLYRLVSYWLALLLSGVAFLWVRHRHYL